MSELAWWQRGVIYQIYPRSFQDSNGDGIGDLAGMNSRLPYLAELGVDAVWVSPIYPSPMADFGYDVADYCNIDPMFGTLADFKQFADRAHGLGMKVLLDFVPNHSSDRHPWFEESRSSRDNPKRDWYVWRDPAPGGGPPNNWQSRMGGSAWEWDERTGQYYYHAFLREQPDLNWRNPQVRRAMDDVLRFWLAGRAAVLAGITASTAFVSTCCGFSSRTRSSATIRRIPPMSRVSRTITGNCTRTPKTSPKCTTSCARCAPRSPNTASVC
ncbi:glycosidase [Burkholderia sp. OAS925]